ncbi:phage head spike fiber domain-containing protein [Desulfovibrio inopinatus]|uniref:phage head spike fiber domain-containing protein n=1 Tax=Desulfovibrio inopinatus TaxID=102109 RepID=UPI0003F850A1|nr:hypothetical protein [Desulfovibrio inopinatus]
MSVLEDVETIRIGVLSRDAVVIDGEAEAYRGIQGPVGIVEEHAERHAIDGSDSLSPLMIGAESAGTAQTLVDGHEASYDHSSMHGHANKTLLDDYTQTDADLVEAVSQRHEQGTDDGTNQIAFRIGDGFDGPLLKRESADALSIRGNADADWADLTVRNLIVKGTTTTIDSETVAVADNILTLNSDVAGTPPSTVAGIEVERGDELNARLVFDEDDDVWKAGIAGSEAAVSLVGHGHIGSDVSDLPWTTLTGVPTTFAPSAHADNHKYDGPDALSANDVGAYSKADLWHKTGISPVDTFPSLHFRPDANTLPDGVTFSRNSIATFFDAAGIVRVAAANSPRFAYDPVTGRRSGLIIEEERTNIIYYSDLSSVWYATRSNRIANATHAPDGTVTASKFCEGTEENSTHLYSQGSITLTPNETYTRSVFVKSSGDDRQLLLETDGYANWVVSGYVIFDIENGKIVLKSNVAIKAGIEDCGDGWFRCWLISTAASSVTSAVFDIALANKGVNSYSGDGVSGIYIWGAQLEAGDTVSSYIPTTSTFITRRADVCHVALDDIPFHYGQGTIFLDVSIRFVGINTHCLVEFIGSSTDNRIFIQLEDGGNVTAIAISDGVTSANIITGNFTEPVQLKIAFSWNEHGFIACVNGNEPIAMFGGNVPVSLETLRIGAHSAGNHVLNGEVNHCAFFSRAFEVDDLQRLTQ